MSKPTLFDSWLFVAKMIMLSLGCIFVSALLMSMSGQLLTKKNDIEVVIGFVLGTLSLVTGLGAGAYVMGQITAFVARFKKEN